MEVIYKDHYVSFDPENRRNPLSVQWRDCVVKLEPEEILDTFKTDRLGKYIRAVRNTLYTLKADLDRADVHKNAILEIENWLVMAFKIYNNREV